MNTDFAILAIMLAVSVTTNLALVVGWFRASRRASRLEAPPPEPRRVDDRTEQLERTIDALTAQIDQLASGQEFINRVIAERDRPGARRGIDRPREVTPV
jgi:cell division protein FtsB